MVGVSGAAVAAQPADVTAVGQRLGASPAVGAALASRCGGHAITPDMREARTVAGLR